MHWKRLAILGLGWWLWGASVAQSGTVEEFQRETLRDLPGVWVVVEQLAPELEHAGLTHAQLQHNIEDTLRRAGITVLTEAECWQTPGMPWLYVTVALLQASADTYAASIAATLYQEVQLTREPQRKTFGATWDSGVQLGAVERARLAAIQERTIGLIDQFTADYQAVNAPRKNDPSHAPASL
jgi:hypothetical protein